MKVVQLNACYVFSQYSNVTCNEANLFHSSRALYVYVERRLPNHNYHIHTGTLSHLLSGVLSNVATCLRVYGDL